jgi:GTP pyrophosphokinase
MDIHQFIDENKNTKLEKVKQFGEESLCTVVRQSGENYAQHCIELASTLLEVTSDTSVLASALIHDLPIHPDGQELLRVSPLNDDERLLVHNLFRLRCLNIGDSRDDLDKVISAFSQDGRLLVMRMAHRLNDIRNLGRFPDEFRKTLAHETLHMYTAIAGRMGLHSWRYEMEDICFKLLHPQEADNLLERFASSRKIDLACLKHTREFLSREFKKMKIDVSMTGRIKNLYSTYRKMILKQRTFEELTDRLALRVIVDNLEDCYRVLGMVHNVMHPIPGKLKDYIGAPKENGYRSIHTVVYPLPGVTQQPIEIQIRTREIDRECEYGSLSHHNYKEWSYSIDTQPAKVNLFSNLSLLKKEAQSPSQFEKALRTYYNEKKLIVFDPKNNIYHLNQPSSAMDFCLTVHKERCSRLKEVKINGRNRPLDTPLKNGDVVECAFGRNLSFKNEWMTICYGDFSKQVAVLIHSKIKPKKALTK